MHGDRGFARRRVAAIGVALLAVLAPPPTAAQAPAGPSAEAQLDALFWQSVMNSEDRAQYAAYLARFPNGTFAELARLKIAAIDQRGGAPAGAPAAPPAPPAGAKPAAAPPPASTQTPTAMSDADLFATAVSQVNRPFAGAADVTATIPEAPALTPVPALALPERFCSAEARNAFYETRYQPAKAIADENNQKTIAHVQAIQAIYERFAGAHDAPAMTIVSREAVAYQPVAAQAYRESSEMAGRYAALMAVPIAGRCD